MNLASHLKEFRAALESHAATYGVTLTAEVLEGLSKYYKLLTAWNPRLHLVAPTSPANFATRHVLESLLLLEYLPQGARVADIGSGAGLPLVPCLVVRPDLQAVLIESSKKKAVFLREALSEVLGEAATPRRGRVIAERFENIESPEVDFLTCRALERFEKLLPELIEWAPAGAKLLFFGGEKLGSRIDELGFARTTTCIPNSKGRFLFVVTKP